MNRWVGSEASVHPVLKQMFWHVSVWFKCKRQIDCWSEHRISAEEAELWPLMLPNPKALEEPLPIPSVHPTVSFENSGRWTHPTNVEMVASVHPMLWLEFQLIQFKRLCGSSLVRSPSSGRKVSSDAFGRKIRGRLSASVRQKNSW
jgi:hypothetical protein